MSRQQVKVGMLGAGFIGQMHSHALRNAGMSRLTHTVAPVLVSLADSDDAAASATAARFGWAETSQSWQEVLDSGIDLFVNAGPNGLHAPASVAAAQLGLTVFCEKPLGRTADEAFDIWRGVGSDQRHRTAFLHRFIPAIQKAREIVINGDIGDVVAFRSNFLLDMVGPTDQLTWRFSRQAAGTGAIGDLGSHHIDVARFIVGEVKEVAAMTATRSKDADRKILDVNDDAFVAIAQFENGATGTFEANRVARSHALSGRFEVDGSKGSLSWNMERLNELTIRSAGNGERTFLVTRPGDPFEGFWLPGGIQGSHPVGWSDCFAHQMHDVLALTGGTKNNSLAATFEDGYRVAEVVEAIDRSANEGKLQSVDYRTI